MTADRPIQCPGIHTPARDNVLAAQNQLSAIDGVKAPKTFSIDSVTSDLKAMEKAAQLDLQKTLPAFIRTSALKKAKAEVQATTKTMAAASKDTWRIQEQLWTAPQARWWTYLIGAGARRQRQIQELEVALREAEIRLRASRIALAAAEAREVREERLAKQEHNARIKEIAASHKAAHHALRLIAAATVIMEETQSHTLLGMDVILREARKRVAFQDANLEGEPIPDPRFTV